MRLFVDWLHGILTVFFAGVLWMFFITSAYDVFPAIALAVVGYALAGLAHPHLKKVFFKKTVMFDIHGVVLGGDFNLETLYALEGTTELVQRLREKYKVAALTNMGPEMWAMWGGKWKIPQKFDYAYYSGQFRIKKPEAKFYELALKDMGSDPKNTVFLDDLEVNVEAAKKLGMKGIVFKNAKQAEEDLKKIGFGP